MASVIARRRYRTIAAWHLPSSHYSEKVRWARIVDRLPARLAEFTSRFEERDGYRWVLEMYRRHRRAGVAASGRARVRAAA